MIKFKNKTKKKLKKKINKSLSGTQTVGSLSHPEID